MQNIEQIAQERFSKNLEYLNKHHNIVYNQILSLSINNYDLEYLDGYFDVKELRSGNYLYAQDSTKVSKELASLVNFKKDSYLFEGFPLYYGFEKHKDEFNDKVAGLEGIYPLMTYYLDTHNEKSEFKTIEKFIFIGVGLGEHLMLIDRKINAKEYLIIEDDLELFYLSLFVTPYYEFENKAELIFAIAQDDNSFIDIVNRFLEDSFYLNRYIKYSYFPAHTDKKIKLIQNAITSQDFISFPYKTLLKKYIKPLEFLNRDFNIINLAKHFKESDIFKKPVLVLGAGPSLHKNIEWLKNNHNRFIVIAVTSVSKTLYENGIRPDIVTHIDGFDTVLKVFDGFDAKEFLKDSIMLFGAFTPTKIRESFNKENMFLTEEDTEFNKGFNSIVGPCIGSSTILYSLIFNAKEIYLLGTDFAISDDGKTHSPTHITKTTLDMSKKDELSNQLSFRGNLFKVKGNFRPFVYTNSLFQVSLQSLYNRIPLLKLDNQNIYNLNDGAKIKLANPKNIDDINVLNIIDKQSVHNEIKNIFLQRSVKKLSGEDMDSLKVRLDIVNKIEGYIKDYKSSAKSNADSFTYNLLGLVSNILHLKSREGRNISKVYYMYFKYTLPLVMDLLNTKGLKNEKRVIKKLDKILLDEVIDIVTIYKDALEKFGVNK